MGDRFESPSKTLTDAHFLFFSGLTGDAHPLHYDVEYAKSTRFGRPLAHGLMLTSMTAVGASTLSPLIEDSIVAFLEQTSRLALIDESGERHYQDDAQKQQLKAEAQAAVAEHCN